MNKLKLFLENFLVYGLGGVINKIIPLIMVPIVTRMMPSSEYFGVNDLSNTLNSFCSAILIAIFIVVWRCFMSSNFVIAVLLAVFLSILYGILYRGEIFTVISKFRKDEYKN